MHAERFRGLVDATGPFVSVYFDDSHDTQDATAQLDARLRDVRKHLEEQSVAAEVIESIETAVRAARPPVGRSGRGVIAAGATIVLDEHLIRPPTSTVLRVSELPYLVPVIEHGVLHTCYLMAAVDHTGADISLHNEGTARAEHVRGAGHPAHETHAAETAGHGGPQGRVQEAVRKNIREVAARLTHLADETGADIVFITGEASARAELMAELPERVAAKAVQLQGGGRTAGIDEAEVHHEIGQQLLQRRLAAIGDAVRRFGAGHGSGLAVDGLADVTAALRDGAVETLIIGDLGDAAVIADHDQLSVIGPDADTVSALGGSPDRVLRADEALPLLAVSIGASLIRADERISPAEGIGAVLRYPDTAAR